MRKDTRDNTFGDASNQSNSSNAHLSEFESKKHTEDSIMSGEIKWVLAQEARRFNDINENRRETCEEEHNTETVSFTGSWSFLKRK